MPNLITKETGISIGLALAILGSAKYIDSQFSKLATENAALQNRICVLETRQFNNWNLSHMILFNANLKSHMDDATKQFWPDVVIIHKQINGESR